MAPIFLGISLLIGLMAFTACGTSSTIDISQPVETAKSSDHPVQEELFSKEIVLEDPFPVEHPKLEIVTEAPASVEQPKIKSEPLAPLRIGSLVGDQAPEFRGISNWINSEPLTMEDLRGKVVLVDFWTYTCYNCINTMPYLRDWHEKYAEKGLVIVGVHSPEFDHEKPYDNVVDATIRHELDYPVAQDNDFKTWRSYNNRYWPAEYLIDKSGVVRYRHFGEGAYEETENVIRDLLEEAGADLS